MQKVAVPPDGYSVQRLGTHAAGNVLRFGRVLKTPRAGHHANTEIFIRHISFCLHPPHQNRIGQSPIIVIGVMVSPFRRRLHPRGHRHRERTVKYRMFCPEMMGICIQAKAIPIGFQPNAPTEFLAHFYEHHCWAVEIIRQIARRSTFQETPILAPDNAPRF